MWLKEFLRVFRYDSKYQVDIREGEPTSDDVFIGQVSQHKGQLYKIPEKYLDYELLGVIVETVKEPGNELRLHPILVVSVKEK